MVAARADADAVPRAKVDAETDEQEREPRLCSEPTEEQDNGASPRARAYQEQISAMINPQRPLPYGLTMAFFNPVTGRWVKPDECDEANGDLIEAKGPGFAKNLKYDIIRKSYEKDFVGQARAQVEVAGTRAISWYFAEQETADFAAELFEDQGDLAGKIQISVREAIMK